MRTGYSVTIKEVIGRETPLSAKEKVKYKDFTPMIQLDRILDEQQIVTIHPLFAIVADVHNENSENTDYTKYILVDTSGEVYITGSETFWNSFIDMFNELQTCDEDWDIMVYKSESKNYKGKQFITCTVQ